MLVKGATGGTFIPADQVDLPLIALLLEISDGMARLIGQLGI